MVLLGTIITGVKAMVVTSGTDNDRVLKLLLKKLSFKSGTDSQRRLTGEEPEMPMTLFPSVGSCYPTMPFSTFAHWVRAIQPYLSLVSYIGLCHTTNLPSFVHWVVPYNYKFPFFRTLGSCHPNMPFSTFVYCVVSSNCTFLCFRTFGCAVQPCLSPLLAWFLCAFCSAVLITQDVL